MDLEKIFGYMSQKMIIEWEQIKSSVSHAGLKGTSLETEFKEFLRKYLPKSLEISSGIVVDSTGKESKQLDVIIHDALKTPMMFNENDVKVIPVECVYAIIEVKANIESTNTVDGIYENMKSVKDLEKTSYVVPIGDIKMTIMDYGKEWEIWPIHYFVFAIDSINLPTIVEELNKKNQEENREVSKRIDCICVLNKGVILNRLKNGQYSGFPEPESVMVSSNTKKPLLFFYRLISGRLFEAWMPVFRFDHYTKNIRF